MIATQDDQVTIPQLVLEYFKTLRGEINTRLQKNANLWSIKITAAGVLFAYLGKSGPEADEPFVFLLSVVPWIVVVFDFLITDNLLGIHNIGIFIKYRIEHHRFDSRQIGFLGEQFWEHLCGQCEETRTLETRHRRAMMIFASACAAAPALLYFLRVDGNRFFQSPVWWLLFASIVSAMLIEIWLLAYFRTRIYSVDQEMKGRIEGMVKASSFPEIPFSCA